MSKNEKKILTQKWLLKLKNVRKPDRSRIKFYHMQPFKAQVLVYFDREITKIWFSSLSMFSNNWPIMKGQFIPTFWEMNRSSNFDTPLEQGRFDVLLRATTY